MNFSHPYTRETKQYGNKDRCVEMNTSEPEAVE